MPLKMPDPGESRDVQPVSCPGSWRGTWNSSKTSWRMRAMTCPETHGYAWLCMAHSISQPSGFWRHASFISFIFFQPLQSGIISHGSFRLNPATTAVSHEETHTNFDATCSNLLQLQADGAQMVNEQFQCCNELRPSLETAAEIVLDQAGGR